ncbi:hypothetical protein BAE44_0025457 [Dichanthelium oligosanthes]|uniref:DUF7788 domain-containing protein n=1 Tax=Dichanthelium oligosanthes TaxID=888268 RepID=A0A1E5UKY3_9POAL|nr:hypothetical protein BAE44_0025457 [Dichanthelium oligosanthes]
MSGTSMEVCVALGLLISELSEKQWAGRIITSSQRPQIHKRHGARPGVGEPLGEDYQVIYRKFRAAGYGDVVPQIVFWNLRDLQSTLVTSAQPGVAMVSGFSKNLVKLFLENDAVVSPEAVMVAAILSAEYKKLAVFD